MCFDPVIDILDAAIEETIRQYPSIKVGQLLFH